jgi:crossover junction endodeoxyribonuclease RuvC
MTIVLGLDPGSVHLGFGVIEARGSVLRPIAQGTCDLPRSEALPQRLERLYGAICGILDRYPCDEAAIERIFTARNAASALVLAHARGVILLALAQRGLPIAEYAPAEVKMSVTGHGRRDKQQVAGMVGRILGLPVAGLAQDATDALAVAICHAGGWRRQLALAQPPPQLPAAGRPRVARKPREVRRCTP